MQFIFKCYGIATLIITLPNKTNVTDYQKLIELGDTSEEGKCLIRVTDISLRQPSHRKELFEVLLTYKGDEKDSSCFAAFKFPRNISLCALPGVVI